ncbi:uncharacterized protein N7511_001647 [Penicillium nucicola]|uniref:uncharacterized protein n=1 Tax=Penicillium nucicola TaxID=1850975 RepID=UPI0025453678|nr:uncharacterized protein N7511_001647 [Penicillium nucicola]KAJ5776636.1 hypothetical protein N7511_001647 [Penicillium nucicola]
MPLNSLPQVPSQEVGHFNPSPNINPPPSATTSSYKLNHLAIRITDPTVSLNFYITLLGMRIIFTMNAGPFTIYYLGHPPPDIESAEQLDTWAKKTAEIPNMTATSGLLELYHVHGTEKENIGAASSGGGGVSTGNTPPHLGFAHLGFTVPDVPAAVARLREAGVTILKDVGVSSRETVPLSEWEAERGIGRGEIHENYAWFFEKFAMVSDPDGYTVELIPQSI